MKEMTFWEHLAELRRRLFFCVAIVMLLGSVCYAYWDFILQILVKPAGHRELVYLSLMEPFMARFKLAMWGGFLLSFPFILYQILAFIIPGLNRRETAFLLIMVIFMVVLFYGGIAFGYTFILSIGIKWLEAQGSGLIKANLSISQYISFVGLFLLAFGVSFETPVVVVLLSRVGVVRPITLLKQWRIAVAIILVVSAIITPDWSPITMILMALPMSALYLLGVALAFVFAPRKQPEVSAA